MVYFSFGYMHQSRILNLQSNLVAKLDDLSDVFKFLAQAMGDTVTEMEVNGRYVPHKYTLNYYLRTSGMCTITACNCSNI